MTGGAGMGGLALAALLAAAAPAWAEGYRVYVDDRGGFTSSLTAADGAVGVVDSDGAFAADPVGATGLSSVTRTGAVGGRPYSYVAYDVDFADGPPGWLVPGQAGGDVAGTSNLDVESPVAQGGATGVGSWGLDGGSGSPSTRNALLVDFTGGTGVGHFGVDLVDFEASSAFTSGQLRLYDDGVLVFTTPFAWDPSDGDGERHFLGVAAVAGQGAPFDQVAVVLGDDSGGGGNAERWAADRISFGQGVVAPEPSSGALLLSGLALLVACRVRQRRARRCARTRTTNATKS